jgi:hypothetical protein
VDEPDRWAITIWLAAPNVGRVANSPHKEGRLGCPEDSATTDLTPRRCQKFLAKANPGDKFSWTATAADGKVLQSGVVEADKLGLLTVSGIKMAREKVRIEIKK